MLDEPVEQQVAHALALHVGVDGDRAHLRQVLPHDVERAAADHRAVELRDEELLDVLVQLDGRLLQQDAPGVDVDQPADGRDVGGTCTADHGAMAREDRRRHQRDAELRRDPTVRSSDRCRVPSSTSTATRSTRSSTGRAASASWSSGPPSWRCPPSRSPTTAPWPEQSSSTALAGKAGIRPIIGCEVYVVEDRRAKEPPNQRNWAHLTLIAETTAGYHNLVKLVSDGYLEGFHYKPRVDFELLERYAGGLIALSGCLASRVNQALLEDDLGRARTELDRLVQVYGRDSVYVELQDAGLDEHQKVNVGLLELADETGLPLVGTGDVHYLRAEDADPHEVLLCVQTGDELANPRRFRFPNKEFYFKTPDEMARVFAALRPRAAAADAGDRRALQRRARARRHPAAALRRAAGRGRLAFLAPALRGGAGSGATRWSTTRCATGSRSS